jgi:hypothetical protein
MLHLIARQLRRLQRSVGRQGATDNAASALAEHARMLAEIDDLANRVCTSIAAPERAA